MIIVTCNMHGHFLNSTGEMGISKQQGHVTLAFLKICIRHQDPPSRAPMVYGPGRFEARICHCIFFLMIYYFSLIAGFLIIILSVSF